MSGPFGAAALLYHAKGWPVLPLYPSSKPGGKGVPPKGCIGYAGEDATREQLINWRDTGAAGAPIAIRMPEDVLAIDVDDGYPDRKGEPKQGAATLAGFEEKWGPLPATWASTSRGDEHGPGASRKLYFRVPPGDYRDKLGPDVEIIDRHHRLDVVWPSKHVDTGREYRWYDPRGYWAGSSLPSPGALADLPETWVTGLLKPDKPGAGAGSGAVQALWADRRPQCGPMADAQARALGRLQAAADGRPRPGTDPATGQPYARAEDRHGAMTGALVHVVQTSLDNHAGGGLALEAIESLWANIKPEAPEDELTRALDWAADAAGLDDQPGPDPCAISDGLPDGSTPAKFYGGAPEEGGELENLLDSAFYDVENAARAGARLRYQLGYGRLAGLYLRDGLLVHTPRVGEDGYVMPTPDEQAHGVDHGPAQIQQVDQGRLRALVEVKFGVFNPTRDPKTKKITGWSAALFPPDAARHAASAAELGIGCPNLTRLAGVTHTPVLRPDGSVLSAPGYDAATGLLYLPPPGLTVPEIPDAPTAEQVKQAAGTILEPIALFPFVSEHHRANYLGAMLTPVLRLVLPAPYQLVIITATNAGSGKTLLMRLLGNVHGIVTRGEFPRDRDELRKLFLSTLLTTTAPVIGMDNIRGTIYSSELESLLTARELTDRQLGASRVVTVANDRLWVATGNNARIGGDLARRCLPVALDPQCPDPHKRKFAFDPAAWMSQHRGEYIAALLTVARGHIQAGGKQAQNSRSDDYARWYSVLRGLLDWAPDLPGGFGTEDPADLSVISEDDAEWAAFLMALAGVFGWHHPGQQDGYSFTARQVVARIETEPLNGPSPLLDSLPGDLAEKYGRASYTGRATGFARSLGKWLQYRDGRYTAEGLALRKQPDTHGALYSIERAP